MVLSAALDNGYIFMVLIAIVTSVIGAGYYLHIVKQIFFYKEDYRKNPSLLTNNVNEGFFKQSFQTNTHLVGYISPNKEGEKKVWFKPENITINSSLSGSISIITLLLILFIYMPTQWFNLVNILTLILFKA